MWLGLLGVGAWVWERLPFSGPFRVGVSAVIVAANVDVDGDMVGGE